VSVQQMLLVLSDLTGMSWCVGVYFSNSSW